MNLGSGAVTEILQISEADKLVGMTADADGLLYITEGDVVPSRLFVANPVTGTYEVKGFLANGSAGDLTWVSGELYNASEDNKLVQVNIESPETSIIIGDFTGIDRNGDRIFAMVSVFESCSDQVLTYGLSEFGDYYTIDINTAAVTLLCSANIDIYGATSADEFRASEDCDLSLDLDDNDSEGLSGNDYQTTYQCQSASANVADLDAIINSVAAIDSISVELISGVLNGALEVLIAGTTNNMSISSSGQQFSTVNTGSATISDFEILLQTTIYRNSAFPISAGTRTVRVIAYSANLSDTAYAYIDFETVYAGEDGMISFCEDDNPANLFNSLGSNPDGGGAWFPVLTSGTGVFDPSTDIAGTYFYVVSDGCVVDTAEVEVDITNFDDFTLGSDTLLCNSSSFTIDADIGNPNAIYSWSNGASSSSISVNQTENYAVTIDIGNCQIMDDIDVEFIDIEVELGPDVTLCPGDYIYLGLFITEPVSYLWSDGSTSNSIIAYDEGLYSVTVSYMHCELSDSVYVSFTNGDPIPVNLGEDQTICESESITLSTGYSTSVYDHLWSNGSTNASIDVSQEGIYWVSLSNDCQTGSDSVQILVEFCDTVMVDTMQVDTMIVDTMTFTDPCYIDFPKAFTPDGDGLNDFFYPLINCPDLVGFTFRIYNRYGEKIFDSLASNNAWDGSFKNKPALQDVYVWFLEYERNESNTSMLFSKTGTIAIIR